MKFKRILISRATLKKQQNYQFDFTKQDLKSGRKATIENPYFCKREKKSIWFALYTWKGKLIVYMLHSYDKFEEIFNGA